MPLSRSPSEMARQAIPQLASEFRKAVLMTPEQRQEACLSDTLNSILTSLALCLERISQLPSIRHNAVESTALEHLRRSPVLRGSVPPAAAAALTVPVFVADGPRNGLVWVNCFPDADSMSDFVTRVRAFSCAPDRHDIGLFAGEERVSALGALQPTSVLTCTVIDAPDARSVPFMSRALRRPAAAEQSPVADRRSGEFDEVPTVPGSYMMGNVRDVQRLGLHAAADRWIAAHGDIVRVDFLGEAYVVRRPAFARQVLAYQNKLAPPTHVGGGAEGLFFADGGRHARLRKALNPCFYAGALKALYPEIQRTTDRFCQAMRRHGVEGGRPVETWRWAVALFYDSTASAGLGCPEAATCLDALARAGDEAPYPRVLELFDAILDAEKVRQVRGAVRLRALNDLPTPSSQRYWRLLSEIYRLAGDVVRQRVRARAADPGAPPSFLDPILDAPGDPDAAFRAATAQVLNFFRAGTDTTASALVWTLMELTRHPDAERRLVAEVDAAYAAAGGPPGADAVASGMPYLHALLNEVMRLHPPANVLIRGIDGQDLVLTTEAGEIGHDGRTYCVPVGSRVMVDIVGMHRDPRCWRAPLSLDPDRFLDGRPREPGSFIPFGGGPRTCIGNIFGILEVKTALVRLYRDYTFESLGDPWEFSPGDPQKPTSGARLRMRHRRTSPAPPRAQGAGPGPAAAGEAHRAARTQAEAPAEPPPGVLPAGGRRDVRTVLAFGSNQGTCESLARELSAQAAARGLGAATVCPLDAVAFDALADPERGPACLIVCVSTYNGQPPDNAAAFLAALRGAARRPGAGDLLNRLQFAVFGAGNSNWGASFLKIPEEVDGKLRALGAQRLAPMGHLDEAGGPASGRVVFRTWMPLIWTELGLDPAAGAEGRAADGEDGPAQSPATCDIPVYSNTDLGCAFSCGDEVGDREALRPCSSIGSQPELMPCAVVKNERLTATACPQEVRHVELDFGGRAGYEAGDHLEVHCTQSDATVRALCLRLGVHPDAHVRFGARALPVGVEAGRAYNVGTLLATRDLSWTPGMCSALLGCDAVARWLSEADRGRLADLCLDRRAFEAAVRVRGMLTVLDVLGAFPSLQVDLAGLLSVTFPLRRRYYSISSAPGVDAHVSVTVGVVKEAYDGRDPYHGVASWPLSRAGVGSVVTARVVASTFRLPAAAQAPMIWCCAGTGIAPFRAFWRQQASQRAREGGPVLLYAGFRDEAHALYTGELRGCADRGDVQVVLPGGT